MRANGMPATEMTATEETAAEANPPAPSAPRRVNTTVAQAFEAMQLIAQSPRPLTFTEVAERLGLPVATAHRVLASLETTQYVERLADNGYVAGVALNEARDAVFRSFPVVDHASDVLAELAHISGETAALNCRLGCYVVRADGFESRSEMRRKLHLGEVYPLHLGAGGRAVLAHLAHDEVDAYCATNLMARHRSRSFSSAQKLRQELARITGDGFALDSGDLYPEAHSIAWPVFGDSAGTPIASLLISGPARRFEPSVDAGLRRKASAVIASFQDQLLANAHGQVPASVYDNTEEIRLPLAPYQR